LYYIIFGFLNAVSRVSGNRPINAFVLYEKDVDICQDQLYYDENKEYESFVKILIC
jgi:hypothetical protein